MLYSSANGNGHHDDEDDGDRELDRLREEVGYGSAMGEDERDGRRSPGPAHGAPLPGPISEPRPKVTGAMVVLAWTVLHGPDRDRRDAAKVLAEIVVEADEC